MAVQPLTKTKIIKKVTKHPMRFQSHQWARLGVSSFPIRVPALLREFCRSLGSLQSWHPKAGRSPHLCVFVLGVLEEAQRY